MSLASGAQPYSRTLVNFIKIFSKWIYNMRVNKIVPFQNIKFYLKIYCKISKFLQRRGSAHRTPGLCSKFPTQKAEYATDSIQFVLIQIQNLLFHFFYTCKKLLKLSWVMFIESTVGDISAFEPTKWFERSTIVH